MTAAHLALAPPGVLLLLLPRRLQVVAHALHLLRELRAALALEPLQEVLLQVVYAADRE